MSPILVRPVREQLEHDRVIRLLQAKYKRKFEVSINPGTEQTAPVGTGPSAWYPDLVLQAGDRGHKLLGTVEVETIESVNNLEAMSQWVALSRLRAPFHLYIPAPSIDVARRLCEDFHVAVAELWAYSFIGDQMRVTLVQRAARAGDGKARTAAAASRTERPAGRAKPARAGAAGAGKRPARSAAKPKPKPKSKSKSKSKAKGSPAASARRKGTAKRSTPAKASAAKKKVARSSRASKRK